MLAALPRQQSLGEWPSILLGFAGRTRLAPYGGATGHDFEQVGPDPVSPSANEIHQRTIAFFKRYLGKEQAR